MSYEFSKNSRAVWAVLSVFSGALAGCTTFYGDQPDSVALERIGGSPWVCHASAESARRIVEYATFAAKVYLSMKEEEALLASGKPLRGLGELSGKSCADADEGDPYVLKLPEGWAELKDLPPLVKRPGHWSMEGLQVRVWYEVAKERPRVVIAFRGTEAADAGDWWSNFRWITRIIPFIDDQYDQLVYGIDRFADAVRQRMPAGAVLITTGHSLGGGLAHQAAYKNENIKQIYAFDSSVVTGYFNVSREQRERHQKGMRIERIYEHGEILAYVGWFFRQFVPVSSRDPEIKLVRFNLMDSNNIFKQHSMSRFACLIERAASGKQGDVAGDCKALGLPPPGAD